MTGGKRSVISVLLWEKMEKAAKYHHEKQAQKEEAYREQYGEGGRELEKVMCRPCSSPRSLYCFREC